MSQTGTNRFCESALNPSITALELFHLNADHSPNHPLFIFELSGVLHRLTWKQVVGAIEFAACLVVKSVADGQRNDGTPPVVGILASSDAITHYTVGFGILRAGFPTFHISTRNSPAAIAHLLSETKCHHIFVSEDAGMQGLCSAAIAILGDRGHTISVYRMPHYADLYVTPNDALAGLLPPLPAEDLDKPALILHSSGSTSHPKPIYVSHRILMQWIRHPTFADGDLTSDTIAVHALPMHHGMCLLMTCWSSSTGMAISCFPPVFPPVQPTPDTVLQGLAATNSTLVFCVPSFLEHWAKTPEKISILSRLKAVSFAGAPLSPAVGDFLVESNVPMVHIYGSTEIGCGTVFMPKTPQREDWNYLKFSPDLNYIFVPHGDEGLHELVFLEGTHHRPCKFNTVIDGQKAYATNDLLIRHPTNPTLWRVHGRKDDQLMLSTGEKTNPEPFETTLCRDHRVAHAIMFGRGREHNGVIVQPQPEYIFDPSDLVALTSFRDHIWPTVVEANAIAPSHSRLFKEECMILVTPPSKLFDLTAKGTPRRGFILASYEKEIGQAYDAVKESSLSDVPQPSYWDSGEILEYIRNIIRKTLREVVEDDSDLFQHGCDSLQATWIRNTILHALRHTSDITVREIPQSLVYENPSISSLASYISKLISSPSASSRSSSEESIKAMHALVTEASKDFTQQKPSRSKQIGDVILLTGSSGSLGSHLLAQLLVLPEASRVYAINRGSRNGVTLYERQRLSFQDRDLDVSLLASPKLVLVEADISLPLLGLTETLFGEIRDSITHIFHNAWRVDFKVSMQSFKPNVQSVRNLINLALSSPLSSPPAFVFVSSVGVLRNWASPGPVPEAPVDAETAVGSGYSESKWVSEMMLRAAAKSTALRPTIVRIDQLSGAANGSWNQTDSIPAIVRSGQVLGCLPDRQENIAWLPVECAAASIIETRGSEAPFLHLRNPHTFPWPQVFGVISDQLGIGLVPYAEWLARLAAQGKKHGVLNTRGFRHNPALLLLEFFKSIDEDRGPMVPAMDISEALQRCKSLESASLKTAMSEKEVRKWIGYWRRKGLLEE